MSKASDIATALCDRLAQIVPQNGYPSGVGARVFRGKRDMDPSLFPCSVLIESDDSVSAASASKNTKVTVTADYFIEAFLACDPDHPNDAAHQAITDLKRAMFGGDPSYGDLIRKGLVYVGRVIEPRDAGVMHVAVSIHVQAEYFEDLINP